MRILFDTNVLIAGLISHCVCYDIIQYAIQNHEIITSQYIINEFREKLKSKFKFSEDDIDEAAESLFEKFNKHEIPNTEINIIFKDKDDIPILATAINAKCDYLITGDKDLIELAKINNCKIIKPADLWKIK